MSSKGVGRVVRAFAGVTIALALVSCTSVTHENQRLARYDPDVGYRPRHPAQRHDPNETIFFLAFSGGGTRAGAFAYGVMEELRDTMVTIDGETVPLLSEVDSISGVSGGSFPAAYYGLFGDRIFEDFEARFLKKNVQGALLLRVLAPWNLIALLTPFLDRTDLASAYYDKYIFDGTTFADLRDSSGPKVFINATDLSSGERFTFIQGTFDLICSDLDPLPISTAVAASAAVPVVLSPVTLRNYAGTCGFEAPKWVADVVNQASPSPRVRRSVETYLAIQDPKRKPFIHLIDGSIADNLGLRSAIDFVEAAGGIERSRRIVEVDVPDRMVILSVNAETIPNPLIDLSDTSPTLAMMMDSVTGAQIRRANFETLLLTEELLHRWGRDLSTEDHTVKTFMVTLGFRDLEDDAERRRLNRLPTSFALLADDVDRLRAAGRKLLRESPVFQALLADMR